MAAAPVLPASPAPTPEPAPLSEGARLINTFIAPSKTFTDLRRAKWWSWVMPWILIGISSIVFMYAIGKQVGFEQIARNAIAHSSRATEQFDRLSPSQQASQLRLQSKIMSVASYASPLLILLYCLIGTVAIWLTFKLGFQADTTFGQGYAITMYAWLPGIIGGILGTVALFAGVNPEGFDINNPVGTNVGYYLDPETTSKFVRGMASSLDIFAIWTIVLIGIGYSCTSKVKRSTAIITVAVWFLIFKLVTSALGALG